MGKKMEFFYLPNPPHLVWCSTRCLSWPTFHEWHLPGRTKIQNTSSGKSGSHHD
jgi:hypothetical protein